jgi:hypothetical protein
MSDTKSRIVAQSRVCAEPEATRLTPDDHHDHEANWRLAVRLLEALRAAGFECELGQVSLH